MQPELTCYSEVKSHPAARHHSPAIGNTIKENLQYLSPVDLNLVEGPDLEQSSAGQNVSQTQVLTEVLKVVNTPLELIKMLEVVNVDDPLLFGA